MPYFRILLPFLALCLNILLQITAYKYLVKSRLLKSEYFGFAWGCLVLLIFEFIVYQKLPKNGLSLLCADLIIYGCLSYGFFTFINMGETARRIRLLRELYESPAGLTKEQVLEAYSAGTIVNQRLERLLNNHQIVLRDGRYYAGKPLMFFISKAILFMKMVVFGKASEFNE